MLFRKDYSKLLELTLNELDSVNYADQFLDLCPDFFAKHLPVSNVSIFVLNRENTEFALYSREKNRHLNPGTVTVDSNLAVYLKNSKKTVVMKDEKPSRVSFLKKTDPELFECFKLDVAIPFFSFKKLHGFAVIEARGNSTYKDLDYIEGYFKVIANIMIPLVVNERIQLENDKNYYKIFRMDRLAMVGELAASAAHEIKNPLAGISTFLKYFNELEAFSKSDIIEELGVMKQSVTRIDEIVKSLLSFSRFKTKKVANVNLAEIIESSIDTLGLKLSSNISVKKDLDHSLAVETDFQHLQHALVNILFNAVEAIGKEKKGAILVRAYVSGRDQLPSKELFNISIKDNGPGIDENFKARMFQPFQTTKEEGTGLGLYTCYGLLNSLGGTINVNSSKQGTEVIVALPYSFDEE
ncbi:MAG: hypothetical protein GY757_60665 [bacterium]|nr:hypothetical protein [bacterium]